VKETYQIGNLDLESSLGEEVEGWLGQQQGILRENPPHFPIAFSLAARQRMEGLFDGSLPLGWTPLTLLRAKLLLSESVFEKGLEWIEECFRTADLGESLDLYRLLPLVESECDREALVWRIGEGLRTNAPPVFEAVAHNSALPAQLLSEETWNQMVLKALFIDVSVTLIVGWQERRNPTLDAMALRFASERAMAHREIPEDVWNLVMDPISEKGQLAVNHWVENHPREHFVHLLKTHYSQS